MTPAIQQSRPGQQLPAGAHDYRAFIGPREKYDLVSAMQFILLTALGLREHHFLLDIGCGSLRGGKLFIPFLLPERYFGIEPEQWLIAEGVRNEIGQDMLRIKRPTFSYDTSFSLSSFGRTFDFILAQSIFSHASQDQIIKCLSQARKAMHDQSIFAATFLSGEQDYTGSEWVYPECVTYSPKRMETLVCSQGLTSQVINWPHPNGQTWMVIGSQERLASLPKLLTDSNAPAELFSAFVGSFTSGDQALWMEGVRVAVQEIGEVVPTGETLILVDENQWGTDAFDRDRRVIPFLERDGRYWGPPADDETAVRELERLRRAGAGHVVFGWPAFWWLEYYAEFHRFLRSNYRCMLENDRLVVFDLRG